jgi:hypothetical protein
MNIWVIIAGAEVLSLIFYEPQVMPKVEELFLYDSTINFIKVETWYREEGTDDASFYDFEMFSRGEVVG